MYPPVSTCFFVMVDFRDASSLGFQMFIPLVDVLKVGSSPLLLRKKLRVVNSFPIFWCYVSGVVDANTVSWPFLPVSMWIFSHISDV